MERFLQYFIPETYLLELNIFSDKEYIDGTVTVTGEILNNVVKFHAVDMQIKEVIFQSQPQSESEITNSHVCQYHYDGQTLEIPISEEMQTSLQEVSQSDHNKTSAHHKFATFIIKYETKLNHNMQGCYVSTYNYNGAEQKLITTQFESHYAREAFPCIDEPAAKAKFNINISAPDRATDDVVLANTQAISVEGNNFHFAETPRMSTYLLAWVIGPLKSVSTVNQHGVKVATYAALNQSTSSLEFANETAAKALDYYDDKFGIKYPLDKLDQVALPDFEAGAMENWGLVTYRESCMLAEPNASIDTKQSVAVTVTHELSHQWFGDLVTMEWWDDLWLNESFATIMEYYATDTFYPEFNVWQDFYTGDCVAALRRDALPGVQSVKQDVNDPDEIATLFDGAIVYAKGARLVLMLIHLMGEESFYKGMKEYFEHYKYSNTVGDDLWQSLQKYANFNIKDFMHAWISQPGYPKVWLKDGEIQQTRFFIDGTTDNTKWPLPEIKDDMSGHYLIELNENEFEQKLTNFENLDDGQKLRLLIDRMLLAKAGSVSSASLVEILPKFAGENAPVWSILLSIINDLKVFFPYDTSEDNEYRQYLRQVIAAPIAKIGIKSQPSDSSDEKRLRSTLAVVARFAKDMDVVQQLADMYRDDLSGIDPEMRGNILMAKMMISEDQTFMTLLQKYQTEIDPELKDDILCTLAIVKNSQNITQAIELLNQPGIIRPQDHIFFFIYLLRNEKVRPLALNWLYNNWNYVERLAGDKSIEDYLRCTSGYINNQEEAQQFCDFFDQYKDNPILKRTLAMAKASIESKLKLIVQESSTVQSKVKEMIK